MRTDITIDRKQVRCPNASHLGFDKYRAQVGDLILFRETHTLLDSIEQTTEIVTGRMIGRISYDPEHKCDGFIVCICINHELASTFERWVNPEDVARVQPIGNEYIDRRAVCEWFLSAEMTKEPIDEVRKSTTDGWSTFAKYRAWKEDLAQKQADFEKRHANCETDPCEFCQKFKVEFHESH